MSDNPWVVVAATVVIVALSAFFVAVEFAALAAKRHRLEEAAPGSRAARAALRNSAELTLLLAGSQLGITAATLALGAVAVAAGAGSFLGTAAGSRLGTAAPDRVVLVAALTATAVTLLAAVFYGFGMAVLVAGVAGVTNAIGKVSLDAIIQREVPENLRASAFARSETVLQLAWVAGGGLAIALPTTGWIGFTAAAVLLALAVGLVLWSMVGGRPAPAPASPDAPTTPVGTQ